MKTFSFLSGLMAFLFFSPVRAQTSGNSIAGLVRDHENKAMPEVIVSLLKKDLSLYKTSFTENSGRFEFEGLPRDSFRLMIRQMGFKQYLSEPIALGDSGQHITLPAVRLEPEGKKLEEVVVTSQLPFIEKKVDRTIVNPDALISNAGSNALDVLAKSPGVTVDENGNIKLKGKAGVVIFIDDKPTYLTASELESYLKSLPSGMIKQIEIMTNPPAQYEAAGSAGIINIKTKKNKLPGMNGNVSANYSQGRYARTMNTLSLNYYNKKINVFSNMSYGYQNSFHDLTISRRYKNEDESTKSIFTQNTYIHPQNSS